MTDIIDWLEPWDAITSDSKYFEDELEREVAEGHILHGKAFNAIGRRYDCDDVLYQIHHPDFNYATVHLTYSKRRENNPTFPLTKTYLTLSDWINDGMLRDHIEYTAG
jgi:hypothetical protein